jgi:hypothetical protein
VKAILFLSVSLGVLSGVWLGVAAWAKSGLPTVSQSWAEARLSSPTPINHTYAIVGNYWIAKYPMDHYQFSLNMDGTWSVNPVELARVLVHTPFVPTDLGWRVLLAYPLLPKVSMERAEYISAHPDTWSKS